MARPKRHAPKLRPGQKYVVRYGNRPVPHIVGPMRKTHSACGLHAVGPKWGTPADDVGPGQRVCKSCDRMKDADTV